METQSSKRILLLDGNSSHCLPLMRSFNESEHHVTVVCPSKFSCGYFSRFGDEKLLWPRITDSEPEFYKRLLNEIKRKKYDFIMGLSDVSARLLSTNKSEIEKYSKTLTPNYDRFKMASDKYLTMKFCLENDIPCPRTIDADSQDLEKVVEDLKFPVVVKPKTGVGAVGFFIIENRESLHGKLPDLKSEYGSMLIQEYIPNENQYTVEAFLDQKSEMKACVVAKKKRFFPINGGTSSCIVTEQNIEITATVKKLLEEIGWVGSANVDLIMDPRDGIAKVIEINPRVGATVKIAHLSGVDIAGMTLNQLNNEYIESVNEHQSGIVMRNMMLDLLWFLFVPLKQKFNSDPSFFRFFGRKVHYQNFSVRDPFPFMGYLISNMMKYANIDVLKRKLGKADS